MYISMPFFWWILQTLLTMIEVYALYSKVREWCTRKKSEKNYEKEPERPPPEAPRPSAPHVPETDMSQYEEPHFPESEAIDRRVAQRMSGAASSSSGSNAIDALGELNPGDPIFLSGLPMPPGHGITWKNTYMQMKGSLRACMLCRIMNVVQVCGHDANNNKCRPFLKCKSCEKSGWITAKDKHLENWTMYVGAKTHGQMTYTGKWQTPKMKSLPETEHGWWPG